MSLVSVLLVACGGGGGSPTTSSGSPTTSNGSTDIGVLIIGGQPLSEGIITVIAPSGSQTIIYVSENGSSVISATDLTTLGDGPYLLKVEGTVGEQLATIYGVAFASDQGSNIIVSPFSEVLLVVSLGENSEAISATPASLTGLTLASLTIVNNNLISIYGTSTLSDFGLPETVNFRTVSVSTNIEDSSDNSGFDNLLDLVKIGVNSDNDIEIDGATISITDLASSSIEINAQFDDDDRHNLRNKRKNIRDIRTRFRELNALLQDMRSDIRTNGDVDNDSVYQASLTAIFTSDFKHQGATGSELYNSIIADMKNAYTFEQELANNTVADTIGYDLYLIRSVGVSDFTNSATITNKAKVAFRLIKKCTSGCQAKEVSRQSAEVITDSDGNWQIKGDGLNMAIYLIGRKQLIFNYDKDSTTLDVVSTITFRGVYFRAGFDDTDVASISISGSGITGAATLNYDSKDKRWEGISQFPGVNTHGINTGVSIDNANYTIRYYKAGVEIASDTITIARLPGSGTEKSDGRKIYPMVSTTTLKSLADLNATYDTTTDGDFAIAWANSEVRKIRTDQVELRWTATPTGSSIKRRGFDSNIYTTFPNISTNKGCKDVSDGIKNFSTDPSCTLKMNNRTIGTTDLPPASGERRELWIKARTPSQNQVFVRYRWR